MCAVCHMTICPSGCPNSGDERAVYTCKCGDPIVENENYYEFDGVYYHEDCFYENAVDILIDIGATKGVADIHDC